MQTGAMASVSGLNDYDYQNLSTLSMGMKQLNQIVTTNKIPIPPEIMDHFKRNPNDALFIVHWLILHHSSRYEMQLHDGPVSGDWPCLVDH